MDVKNFIGLLVFGLIGVIVLTAFVPIISETTSATKTFENDGYFTYDAIDENTDITIVWDATAPDKLTIGDKAVTMPTGAGNWTVVGSTNFTMRYYASASVVGIQCYGSAGYLSANTTNAASGTITINETSMVLTRTNADNTTVTTTYPMGSHGFVINADGDGALMLKYSDESAYVKGDSEVYLCGTTFVTGSGTNDFVGLFGYGSLNDGLTMSAFYGATSPNTVSFGDVTASYTAVSGYINLYQLDKFVFPLTQNDATVTATYSYFVVPTEVTAEKTVHPDDVLSTVIDLLPLIAGIGLFIILVAEFLYTRYL